MFDLVEQSTSMVDNNNNKTNSHRLDIERTFSPQPRLPCIGAKLFIMAWVISCMVLSIKQKTHKSFWLAYLTHWVYLLTVVYFISSVSSAIYLAIRPPANPGVLEGRIGLFLKTMWTLFAIALPSEIIVAILFWVLEFKGDINYVSIMLHAVVIVLLMIDGFILSRIPLRMKQIIPNLIFCFTYILWTVIHSFSGLGNPYYDDGTRDNDAIYDSMAWKENPTTAAIISVAVFFIAYPVVFLFCRALSRLPPMRFCEQKGEHSFKGQIQATQDMVAHNFENDEEAVAAVVY